MTTSSRTYAFRDEYKRKLASCIDAFGHLVFDHAQSLPTLSAVKRLLIVRLDHLGDAICILPLIRQINDLKPKPYLGLCVSSAGALLLRDTPGIDQWIVFDAPWFNRKRFSAMGLTKYRELISTIRAGRFDASLELRGDLRHHVLLWLAGIPYRLGYGNTGGSFLLTFELPWVPERPPIDSNLAFLEALKGTNPANGPALLTWQATDAELDWLAKSIPAQDFILFHIDAGTPAKRWPSDRYLPLLQQTQRSSFLPVLVGSDSSLAHELMHNHDAGKTIDLLGKTTLPQLVTLISRCKGLVSTDSGPAHIAAALNKPTLILWSGTSDPSVWKPRGSSVFCVQTHVPCEYCGNEVCPLPENICMTRITTEQTMPVLEKILQV